MTRGTTKRQRKYVSWAMSAIPLPHVREIIKRNRSAEGTPVPAGITFSVTSINTYLGCPKMYELLNVLNMPTRAIEPDFPSFIGYTQQFPSKPSFSIISFCSFVRTVILSIFSSPKSTVAFLTLPSSSKLPCTPSHQVTPGWCLYSTKTRYAR